MIRSICGSVNHPDGGAISQLLRTRGALEGWAFSYVEGLIEGAALGGIVNGLLDEPELGQQLRARVPAQRHRPCICHLRGG